MMPLDDIRCTWRYPKPRGPRGGVGKAVVATDSESVNADYDNGIGLHHTTRRRRAHEPAAKRVEASVGEKYRPDLIPVAHQPELRKSCPLEYKMGKECGS